MHTALAGVVEVAVGCGLFVDQALLDDGAVDCEAVGRGFGSRGCGVCGCGGGDERFENRVLYTFIATESRVG